MLHVMDAARRIWTPRGLWTPRVPKVGVLAAGPGYSIEVEGRGPYARRVIRFPDGRVLPMFSGAGSQGWVETLDNNGGQAGAQISNTTVETIMAPAFQVPSAYMGIGKTLRLTAFGVVSNVVTTPGTLTFRLRFGTNNSNADTVLLASAALGLDTTAHTNAIWYLEATVMTVAVGPSGSLISMGHVQFPDVLASTNANLLANVLGSAGTPLASGNAAVTVNTAVANFLGLYAAFSVNTSPTNLTCQARIIEALN